MGRAFVGAGAIAVIVTAGDAAVVAIAGSVTAASGIAWRAPPHATRANAANQGLTTVGTRTNLFLG